MRRVTAAEETLELRRRLAPIEFQVAVERVGFNPQRARIDHAQQPVRRDGQIEIGAGDDEAGNVASCVTASDFAKELARGVVTPDNPVACVGHEDIFLAGGDRGHDGFLAKAFPHGRRLVGGVDDFDVIFHAHVDAARVEVLGVADSQASGCLRKGDFGVLGPVGVHDQHDLVTADVNAILLVDGNGGGPFQRDGDFARLPVSDQGRIDFAQRLQFLTQAARLATLAIAEHIDPQHGNHGNHAGRQQETADREVRCVDSSSSCHLTLRFGYGSATSRQTIRVMSRTISRPATMAMGPQLSWPFSITWA